MILEEDQVINIAKSEIDPWIKVAREDSKKLRMHFYGTGTDEFLTKIEGLESDAQSQLRKDHAVTNKFLTDQLLRPIDAIWPAKGGIIKPELDGETLTAFEEIIKQVRSGLSLKKYLQTIWIDKFITDPNGLLFIEATESKEAIPTQKGIDRIKNMKYDGVVPEYVCFEPHTIEEEQIPGQTKKKVKKDLWVVDDQAYYKVKVEGDSTKIIEIIPNSWERVPATSNSPIIDTERKIFISPIWKQIDLFDKYLKNNSVKEIHQFLHGYPIFWEYIQPCNSCNGTGKVNAKTCESCNGTGQATKKDVSDQRKLRPPRNADDPIIAPNVAGYVSPDIASWQEQRTELDWTWQLLYFSMWGTTIERNANETATGRFIDAQPVNNKLNTYADIIEGVHKRALDLIGKYHYENYKGSTVAYGRRFLIETPDQVWEKYIHAKEKKAPVSSKDQLLEQYYDSEYQNNEMLRLYYLKLIKIEPFVHESIQEVEEMGVSEEAKNAKRYFGDWIKTKMINEIIDKNIESLQTDLNTYSNGRSQKGKAGQEAGTEGNGENTGDL